MSIKSVTVGHHRSEAESQTVRQSSVLCTKYLKSNFCSTDAVLQSEQYVQVLVLLVMAVYRTCSVLFIQLFFHNSGSFCQHRVPPPSPYPRDFSFLTGSHQNLAAVTAADTHMLTVHTHGIGCRNCSVCVCACVFLCDSNIEQVGMRCHGNPVGCPPSSQ